jgi:hypothetical protein
VTSKAGRPKLRKEPEQTRWWLRPALLAVLPPQVNDEIQ